ncbi:hypothetical protein C8J57DRAFT_1083228 [Mycena rebaudengoi]|nr:hypothetical protein C8J57DRAFT_1083228 [Mycena rebaudengoi]
MNPPSYEGAAPSYESLALQSLGQSDELPVYSGRRSPPSPVAQANTEPQKFSYDIKNRSRKPWAILVVHGDPRLGKTIPTVVVGSNLTGSVSLALQTRETIQAVVVSVKAEIIMSSGGVPAVRTLIFETKTTLWSAAEGDPQTREKNGKLKGEYSWPFSIHIPATSASKAGKPFELPHIFFERTANFGIQYSVELRIMRGKLRQDDKRVCTLGVFSMRQPGPPSMLRQLAYQENSPLLGPDADPEGWQSLPSFSISGLLFSVLAVDMKCTLALAKPLCYTRSSSIPCALTIETASAQALDVLASPTAALVYLERHTRSTTNGISRSDANAQVCGQAVFWASTEGVTAETSLRRQLMGEIHLRPTLQPSTDVVDFLIEYTVLVFPFQATGFKPRRYAPLLRQKVDIVTRYASGPRAITYTPASYETRNEVIDQHLRVPIYRDSFLAIFHCEKIVTGTSLI